MPSVSHRCLVLPQAAQPNFGRDECPVTLPCAAECQLGTEIDGELLMVPDHSAASLWHVVSHGGRQYVTTVKCACCWLSSAGC
jgi:hypothetical protein